MRKSIKQYIKWLAPLSAAVLVAACSGGGIVTNAGGGSNNNTGGTIALPQTGQTPTLPVNPALVGMDGYTFIGVPWAYVTSGATTPATRFTPDPLDANCIIDNLTGLEWPKNGIIGFSNGTDPFTPLATPELDNTTVARNLVKWSSSGSANEVFTAIDNLNTEKLCGYDDWYLPTINDLSSLLNDGFITGDKKQSTWLISQGFSNVRAGGYWSSSTTASFTSYAWVVYFDYGVVYADDKGNSNYVWPVRLAQ